ncbi:hypothetical protein [Ponticaulis sp.]|uniref:hypothetical protein n=1 Tax=Ponticaulis sp. TaxID=2020902 RepID=UPI000C59F154|nr:hypothetical protein [Ponticaulis sp.]MAJ10650.1 serine endopeptidase [Ponticaulis sp.]
MTENSRRPQQIYSVVMWLISIVFAGCLIGLGSLVIRDLPTITDQRSIDSFIDREEKAELDAELATVDTAINDAVIAVEDHQTRVEIAETELASATDALNAWFDNRTVTEAFDQNPEVAARTLNLEVVRDRLANVQIEQAALERDVSQLRRERVDVQQRLGRLRLEAQPEYDAYFTGVETRVFLYRLMLTLPLLLISGYLVVKHRKGNYWPLCRGFMIFSAFAFFVELVPYLPSYGGYVRYGVGVIIAIAVGHFTILGMKAYLQRQKAAEKRSEPERRKAIPNELALKKLSSGVCPGCDRSVSVSMSSGSDFCPHCGLRIKADCGGCGEHKLVFYQYCKTCGHDCTHDHDEAMQPDHDHAHDDGPEPSGGLQPSPA